LTYFREAAVQKSVRRAGDQLDVAPSAISRQITRLEEELGVSLIDRSARGLGLTEAGALVLEHAERSVQEVNDLRAALLDLKGLRSGRVRVASVEGMAAYFLARYLAIFEKDNPGISVQLSVIGSRAVLDTLRDRAADMALAFNAPMPSPFREHARLDQPLCLIVAPSHPLANRKSVSMKELADCRMALPDESFQIRFLVEHMAARMGVKLKVALETNTLDTVKGVVRNSQLVTFLPRYAALREVSDEDLCAVPLREREFTATRVSLLTSKTVKLAPAAQALLKTLKTAMATYRG
jgi:DNA-binding transcriptional LysR family regulator